MISPEKNIYSSGIKTPDSPGVDQNMWRYNPRTNNYDFIEPEDQESKSPLLDNTLKELVNSRR